MHLVTAHELRKILKSDIEFSVLDVRERKQFSKEHLLLSSCVPLSELEVLV